MRRMIAITHYVSAPKLSQIEAYLEAHSWTRGSQQIRSGDSPDCWFVIWRKGNDEVMTVSPSFHDEIYRIRDVIRALSGYEKRSEYDVWNDIVRS